MKSILRITCFLTFLFILQICLSYFFVRNSYLNQARTELDTLNTRIQDDIHFQDGQWDISRYAADQYTPSPNGSSGFATPLYIITADGLIIERNQPIAGFLDSSNFSHYLKDTSAQTVTTKTNERWRTAVSPLGPVTAPIGIIVVSYYNPDLSSLDKIDEKLQTNLQAIQKQVTVLKDTIDVHRVDIRTIHYDVSFEVITNFNKVLINNGRTPSFIDPSYIDQEIHNRPTEKMVLDSNTNEPYLVHFSTLSDSDGHPIGLIADAKPLLPMYALLRSYLTYSLLTALFFLIPFTIVAIYLMRTHFKEQLILHNISKSLPSLVTTATFNPATSLLMLNDTEIEIPYATNQYYLCKALFSNTSKRWEQDELLETFGEEVSKDNWRKIYDAMIAVNRKSDFKLIVLKEKTYQINSTISVISPKS